MRSLSSSLVEMISSILDVSRLEADELPIATREVELLPLLEEAVEALGSVEATVTVKMEGSLRACCDPDLIRRVVVNLVHNAVKHSKEVEVKTGYLCGEVEVRISDRGPGIPADQLDRIFEKHAQVESADRRQRHSSGLGLTFCRLVVEKHGGRIGVDSQVGEGSQFWFTLPAIGDPLLGFPILEDVPALMARMGGSATNLRVVYEIFRGSRQDQLQAMSDAVAKQDQARLEQAAHTLRGSLLGFGASRAVQSLKELEERDWASAPPWPWPA